MFLVYLLALIPIVIGGILWMCTRKVTWWEWLLSAVIGLTIAGIFHIWTIHTLTADIETWSGRKELQDENETRQSKLES